MADNVLRFDFTARDRASGTFEKLGRESDRLGSKLAGFGKVAGVALAGATAGVAALVTAGATMGIKTAANLEQAQIGFTTLLGSATEAKTFLAGLSKFAASTPFELPGLVDSSRLLIGVGLDTKQTMKTLQAFGDAAGAVGVGQEAFQRVMLATSQAISAGRFATEDLNQITENGIPIWKLLAEATGKPVPELRKLASAGNLLAGDVLPLLQRQMEKDYGGAMAAQSKTLTGLWSTLMDTINIGLAGVLQPLIPALKDGVAGATRIAGDALAKLPGIVEAVRVKFSAALGVAKQFAPVLQAAFRGDWSAAGEALASALDGVYDAVGSSGAKRLIGAINAGLRTGNWSRLGTTLRDGIKGAWDRLSDMAVDFTGKIQAWLSHVDWARVGASLGGAAATALSAAVQGGGALGRAVGEWFAGVDWYEVGKKVGLEAAPFAVGFVATLVDGFLTTAKKHPLDTLLFATSFLAIGKFGGSIAKVLERIPFLSAFAPLFRGIEKMTAPINSVIGKVTGFLGKAFSEGFAKHFPGVATDLSKRLRGVADVIGLRGLYAADKARAFAAGIARGIGDGAGWVVKAVGRIIVMMVSPFVKAGSWLVRRGFEFVIGLARGVGSALGSLAPAASRVIGAVTAPFRGAGRWLVDAGGNIVRGLRNGIAGAMKGIGGWIKSVVVDPIIGAVKRFFGIKSPSTVMAGIGGHLVSGLIKGIASKNPVSLVMKVFGSMPKALAGLFDKGLVSLAGLPRKALDALTSILGKLFGGGGGGNTQNMALGQIMARAYGWVGGQWNALRALWMGESGWNNLARNPSSGAFGIPQALPPGKMGAAAVHGDAAAQIAWGLRYIADRYGSPANAYEKWLSRSPHWYGAGGSITEPIMGIGLRTGQRYGFGESGDETVIPGRMRSVPGQRGGTVVPARAVREGPLVQVDELHLHDGVDVDLFLAKVGFAQRAGGFT